MQNKVASIVLFAVFLAFACQAQPEQEKPYHEHIEVEVLNLEVVVTDRDGQRIPNLSIEDFELFVEGEKIPIDHFTEVRDGRIKSSAKAMADLQEGQVAGTGFLVFIDEFFTIQRDKDRVLSALEEQVADLRPGDQMAVAVWNGGVVEILSDWQSDSEACSAALNEAMAREAKGLERELDRQRFGAGPAGSGSSRGALGSRLSSQERDYASVLAGQLQAAVGAASAAMRSLDAPAGRRALVLLAGGWPSDVASYVGRFRTMGLEEPGIPNRADLYSPLTRTANLTGYTIFPVDVPGLQTGNAATADRSRPTAQGARFVEFQMETDVHDSLRGLASETGGLALLDGDRIDALSDIGDDLRSYYWLGFTPLLEGEDTRRDIEIRLRDPELEVRTRAAYFDLSPESQVELAVESSLLFGPTRRSPLLDVVVSELEKKRRGKVEAKLTFLIRSGALTRVETSDGWTAQAVLFIGALDENGGRTEVSPIQVAVSGKEEPGPDETYRYEKTVRLSWKTQRISVALQDIAGGRTFVTVIDR